MQRTLLPHHSRVLVIDPNREYGRVCVEVQSLEEWATYLESTSGLWRVSFFATDLEEQFDAICDAAWSVGNMLLVVEEVDRFCDPSYIGDAFFRVVNYGRHAPAGPIDYLAISRAPADVHRAITRMAYELYCFTMGEPRDLEYLRKRVSESFANGLQSLPPHHHRFMDLRDRSRGPQDIAPKTLDRG